MVTVVQTGLVKMGLPLPRAEEKGKAGGGLRREEALSGHTNVGLVAVLHRGLHQIFSTREGLSSNFTCGFHFRGLARLRGPRLVCRWVQWETYKSR